MEYINTTKGLLTTRLKLGTYVQVLKQFQTTGIDKFAEEIQRTINDNERLHQSIQAMKVTADLLGAERISFNCQQLSVIRNATEYTAKIEELQHICVATKEAIGKYLIQMESI